MGLFINCHLLFEVQLYLSLHIEVLSFEDSECSMDLRVVGCDPGEWIDLAEDRTNGELM